MAVGTKKDVLKVQSSKLSPKDLEAEIASVASAIGEADTVGGVLKANTKPRAKRKPSVKKKPAAKAKTKTATKTKNKTTTKPKKTPQDIKKSAPKPEAKPEKAEVAEPSVTPKPEATIKVAIEESPIAPKKKPKNHSGKVVVTSDVRPRNHSSVKKKAKRATINVTDENAPSAVKVKVEPKDIVVKKPPVSAPVTKTKTEPAVILNHRGKDVLPLSGKSGSEEQSKPAKVPEPAKVRPSSDEPKAITGSVRVTSRPQEVPKQDEPVTSEPAKPIHSPKPYDVMRKSTKSESKPKSSSASSEPKHVSVHKRTPHVARIYDTNTYHLPLSVDYHHRKAMMPVWGQVATLIAAIVAVVVSVVLFGYQS